MKRLGYLLIFIALLGNVAFMSAQTTDYEQRYDRLVAKVGHAGIGVENLLTKWEQQDSTNKKMLVAKFNYYFSKSHTGEVVKKEQKKYLGMDPLLSLKDSSGNTIYYYQEQFYDDEIYSKALNTVEKAIRFYPDELDYRFLKANALVAYEKESPDMALAYLLDLADIDKQRKRPWNYEGQKVSEAFAAEALQEYCHTFYTVGSPSSMGAFLALSERLYELHPDMTCFLSNVATYYLVFKEDPKKALKYYNKVLKKVKDDEVALRNALVAARKLENAKLEAKYRKQLVKYGYMK